MPIGGYLEYILGEQNMAAKPPWVYMVGAARKVWRWSSERREVKKRATFPGLMYLCEKCNKLSSKKIQIDHIAPVGKAPKGWKGWDKYLQRLFCPVSNLQALCTPCHKAKSKIDNAKTKKH